MKEINFSLNPQTLGEPYDLSISLTPANYLDCGFSTTPQHVTFNVHLDLLFLIISPSLSGALLLLFLHNFHFGSLFYTLPMLSTLLSSLTPAQPCPIPPLDVSMDS